MSANPIAFERRIQALLRQLDEQQRRDMLRFAQALVAASKPRKID